LRLAVYIFAALRCWGRGGRGNNAAALWLAVNVFAALRCCRGADYDTAALRLTVDILRTLLSNGGAEDGQKSDSVFNHIVKFSSGYSFACDERQTGSMG